MTTNRCGFDLAKLSAYVDGALSPKDHLTVEAHLQTCPDCREFIAGLQKAEASLKGAPAPELTPEEEARFAPAVMRQIERLEQKPAPVSAGAKKFFLFRSVGLRWAAAVAAVVLVAITSTLLLKEKSELLQPQRRLGQRTPEGRLAPPLTTPETTQTGLIGNESLAKNEETIPAQEAAKKPVAESSRVAESLEATPQAELAVPAPAPEESLGEGARVEEPAKVEDKDLAAQKKVPEKGEPLFVNPQIAPRQLAAETPETTTTRARDVLHMRGGRDAEYLFSGTTAFQKSAQKAAIDGLRAQYLVELDSIRRVALLASLCALEFAEAQKSRDTTELKLAREDITILLSTLASDSIQTKKWKGKLERINKLQPASQKK